MMLNEVNFVVVKQLQTLYYQYFAVNLMVCQYAGESGVNCATFCHREEEMRCIDYM